MIDRYHLRYFLAVTDHGNFSKAAAACNVSQPTLSVGIAKLEKTLGRTLFVRTNRRVEMTQAGAHLITYARRIEENFALAERDVSDTRNARIIRLGVLVTTPRSWIEAFLAAHGQAGSGERVEILEGRESELLERMARGRIDAALTIIRDERRHECEAVFSEGYSLAMSAAHPLASRETISAGELINETMIVRRHCELLSETSRYFTKRGVRPFFAARTTSDDRAISYVKAGLGVTVMPDGFAAHGMVRPRLQDFSFARRIGLIFAPHTDSGELRTSPPMRLLVQTIERAGAGQRDRRGEQNADMPSPLSD